MRTAKLRQATSMEDINYKAARDWIDDGFSASQLRAPVCLEQTLGLAIEWFASSY
jgi:hypothetical protein